MVYNLKYIYASSALGEPHSKYFPPNQAASLSHQDDHKGKLIRPSAFRNAKAKCSLNGKHLCNWNMYSYTSFQCAITLQGTIEQNQQSDCRTQKDRPVPFTKPETMLQFLVFPSTLPYFLSCQQWELGEWQSSRLPCLELRGGNTLHKKPLGPNNC